MAFTALRSSESVYVVGLPIIRGNLISRTQTCATWPGYVNWSVVCLILSIRSARPGQAQCRYLLTRLTLRSRSTRSTVLVRASAQSPRHRLFQPMIARTPGGCYRPDQRCLGLARSKNEWNRRADFYCVLQAERRSTTDDRLESEVTPHGIPNRAAGRNSYVKLSL